jgi:hypothetical protein
MFAGALGWFGWPRSRLIAVAGLGVGLLGAAAAAEDLFDGSDFSYTIQVGLALVLETTTGESGTIRSELTD